MLKSKTGPKKPSELLRREAPPVASKKSAPKAAGAKKADSAPAESADTGDCTCGAEVGKQIEAILDGAAAPPPEAAAKKGEKVYRKD